MHTTPDPQFTTSWHSLWPKMQATSDREELWTECFEHGGETLQLHMTLVVAKRGFMLQYRSDNSSWHII